MRKGLKVAFGILVIISLAIVLMIRIAENGEKHAAAWEVVTSRGEIQR